LEGEPILDDIPCKKKLKTEIPMDECEIYKGTEENDCLIGEDTICEEKLPPA
jgi:hypothetical protein